MHRDADAITAAFQKFASRKMSREKKPFIRERLEDAKRECVERKPPEVKRPGRDAPEHGDL